MAKALPAVPAHAHARSVMAESPRLVTRMITCGVPPSFSASERWSISNGCFITSLRMVSMARSRSAVYDTPTSTKAHVAVSP